MREAEAARAKVIAEAEAEASRVPPRFARQPPPEKQDPKIKFKDAGTEAENKPVWGEGEEAYMQPKSAADKLRKNVPYKVRAIGAVGSQSDVSQYKFRRNWGDF